MNVATYSRVSSNPQDSGSSPGTQEAATRARVEMEGWTHVGHFHDTISGTVAPDVRPAFSQLLATGPGAILAYAQDRISRDELHWMLLSRDLASRGVAIITCDGVDTRTGDGLLSSIRAVIAAEERRRIAQRTWQGRLASARDGNWLHAQVPTGFRVEDRRLVPDEAEARMLRHAVEMFLGGHALADVARDLNDRGWLTKGGPRSNYLPSRWTTSTLRRVLRQTSLIGKTFYADVPMTWDPIITEETFAHLQELLDQHDGRRRPQHARRVYPLSGHLFLVDEKSARTVISTYQGCLLNRKDPYYRATGRTMIPAAMIESRVLQEVFARLDDEVSLLDAYQEQVPEKSRRRDILKEQIVRVEDDLDVLLSRPGLRQALPRIDALQAQLDALKKELTTVELPGTRDEEVAKEGLLLTARMLREARRPTLKEQEALYRALHLRVEVSSVRPLSYRVCGTVFTRTPNHGSALLLTWES